MLLDLGKYYNISALRAANARVGRHFFDRDTLRFFNSRIGQNVYTGGDGWYFTTSEVPPHGERAYTVRRMDQHGRVHTVGEFMGYRSASAARSAAQEAAQASK